MTDRWQYWKFTLVKRVTLLPKRRHTLTVLREGQQRRLLYVSTPSPLNTIGKWLLLKGMILIPVSLCLFLPQVFLYRPVVAVLFYKKLPGNSFTKKHSSNKNLVVPTPLRLGRVPKDESTITLATPMKTECDPP